MISHKVRRLQLTLLATFALLAAFVGGELAIRLLGHTAWPAKKTRDIRAHGLFVADERIGWVNKPGIRLLPPYVSDTPMIRWTILPGGNRATEDRSRTNESDETRERIVLVGGSFVLGHAISDEETLAWHLQKSFPELQIENFGTGGYGTYQSLLLLEDILAGTGPVPSLVLYGFCPFHEGRNVADADWLVTLSRLANRGHVMTPYCTVDESGKLRKHLPLRTPPWPLIRQSALVASTHHVWHRLLARSRVSQKQQVTELLLEEMNDLCRSYGSRLVVVHLVPHMPSSYRELLRTNGIRQIDCSAAWERTGIPLTVPYDRHPNGIVHQRWAQLVAEVLREELGHRPPARLSVVPR